ncbi:TetR/AcrR family transcriptional regulator [Egibacter rhizosphaerae]|uniref:TetR/AcrR family transcriptional regulator n=1 Tax=Egibacter rhizosphaerae TaxID=1670831 RepID=A0A411YIW5_9ACTN|nr:TetR/AcrR family transcriptional regulator [Egibacter rhizosphaerae]QBI21137.1 TetR/AcrR family transcriptional regulator [Egibacter rhizosphaerae]
MSSTTRESTRDAILEGALEVLQRGGLRDARMEDVAAAAGFSRQSVYYHFRSREELLSALLDRGLGDLVGEMQRAVASAPTEELVLVALRFFAANEVLCRLLVTELWGISGDPNEPREIVARLDAEVTGPMARRLEEEAAAGVITCDQPWITAQALLGQVTGVAFEPIVAGKTVDLELIEPVLRGFTRAVLGLPAESATSGAQSGDGRS